MTTEEGARIIEQERRIEKLEEQLKNSVQVVRCSDCDYRGDAIACPIEGNDLHHISDYDFCSWGERRE